MDFGIPNQRVSRVSKERYPDTPVLTVTADTSEKGSKTSRPMILNTKAAELLGLPEDAKVAFSFKGGIFIANGDNDLVPEEHRLRVTKGYPRKINDKKSAAFLCKVEELDNAVEHNFGLIQVTPDGDPIILFGLQLIKEGVEEVKSEEVVVEDNVEEVESTDSMEEAFKTTSDEGSDNEFASDNADEFSTDVL